MSNLFTRTGRDEGRAGLSFTSTAATAVHGASPSPPPFSTLHRMQYTTTTATTNANISTSASIGDIRARLHDVMRSIDNTLVEAASQSGLSPLSQLRGSPEDNERRVSTLHTHLPSSHHHLKPPTHPTAPATGPVSAPPAASTSSSRSSSASSRSWPGARSAAPPPIESRAGASPPPPPPPPASSTGSGAAVLGSREPTLPPFQRIREPDTPVLANATPQTASEDEDDGSASGTGTTARTALSATYKATLDYWREKGHRTFHRPKSEGEGPAAKKEAFTVPQPSGVPPPHPSSSSSPAPAPAEDAVSVVSSRTTQSKYQRPPITPTTIFGGGATLQAAATRNKMSINTVSETLTSTCVTTTATAPSSRSPSSLSNSLREPCAVPSIAAPAELNTTQAMPSSLVNSQSGTARRALVEDSLFDTSQLSELRSPAAAPLPSPSLVPSLAARLAALRAADATTRALVTHSTQPRRDTPQVAEAAAERASVYPLRTRDQDTGPTVESSNNAHVPPSSSLSAVNPPSDGREAGMHHLDPWQLSSHASVGAGAATLRGDHVSAEADPARPSSAYTRLAAAASDAYRNGVPATPSPLRCAPPLQQRTPTTAATPHHRHPLTQLLLSGGVDSAQTPLLVQSPHTSRATSPSAVLERRTQQRSSRQEEASYLVALAQERQAAAEEAWRAGQPQLRPPPPPPVSGLRGGSPPLFLTALDSRSGAVVSGVRGRGALVAPAHGWDSSIEAACSPSMAPLDALHARLTPYIAAVGPAGDDHGELPMQEELSVRERLAARRSGQGVDGGDTVRLADQHAHGMAQRQAYQRLCDARDRESTAHLQKEVSRQAQVQADAQARVAQVRAALPDDGAGVLTISELQAIRTHAQQLERLRQRMQQQQQQQQQQRPIEVAHSNPASAPPSRKGAAAAASDLVSTSSSLNIPEVSPSASPLRNRESSHGRQATPSTTVDASPQQRLNRTTERVVSSPPHEAAGKNGATTTLSIVQALTNNDGIEVESQDGNALLSDVSATSVVEREATPEQTTATSSRRFCTAPLSGKGGSPGAAGQQVRSSLPQSPSADSVAQREADMKRQHRTANTNAAAASSRSPHAAQGLSSVPRQGEDTDAISEDASQHDWATSTQRPPPPRSAQPEAQPRATRVDASTQHTTLKRAINTASPVKSAPPIGEVAESAPSRASPWSSKPAPRADSYARLDEPPSPAPIKPAGDYRHGGYYHDSSSGAAAYPTAEYRPHVPAAGQLLAVADAERDLISSSPSMARSGGGVGSLTPERLASIQSTRLHVSPERGGFWKDKAEATSSSLSSSSSAMSLSSYLIPVSPPASSPPRRQPQPQTTALLLPNQVQRRACSPPQPGAGRPDPVQAQRRAVQREVNKRTALRAQAMLSEHGVAVEVQLAGRRVPAVVKLSKDGDELLFFLERVAEVAGSSPPVSQRQPTFSPSRRPSPQHQWATAPLTPPPSSSVSMVSEQRRPQQQQQPQQRTPPPLSQQRGPETLQAAPMQGMRKVVPGAARGGPPPSSMQQQQQQHRQQVRPQPVPQSLYTSSVPQHRYPALSPSAVPLHPAAATPAKAVPSAGAVPQPRVMQGPPPPGLVRAPPSASSGAAPNMQSPSLSARFHAPPPPPQQQRTPSPQYAAQMQRAHATPRAFASAAATSPYRGRSRSPPPTTPRASHMASASARAASPSSKAVHVRELHHFPCQYARLYVPYGAMGYEADLGLGGPHTWEDIGGILCGPASFEVLRRYRCPLFAAVRGSDCAAYRVYIIIPEFKRVDVPQDAVLLVLDFKQRVDWVLFLLAMQRDVAQRSDDAAELEREGERQNGRATASFERRHRSADPPVLSYGRALWMLAVQRMHCARAMKGANPFEAQNLRRSPRRNGSSGLLPQRDGLLLRSPGRANGRRSPERAADRFVSAHPQPQRALPRQARQPVVSSRFMAPSSPSAADVGAALSNASRQQQPQRLPPSEVAQRELGWAAPEQKRRLRQQQQQQQQQAQPQRRSPQRRSQRGEPQQDVAMEDFRQPRRHTAAAAGALPVDDRPLYAEETSKPRFRLLHRVARSLSASRRHSANSSKVSSKGPLG